MTLLVISKEFITVEAAIFEWLASETGDANRAAQMARSGLVEQTLELNPGLAALQAQNNDSLPLGSSFVLPPLPDMAVVATVKLWGDD